MKQSFFLLILLAFLSCSKTEQKPPTIQIVNTFDSEEVKWFQSEGTATLKGTAKFKSLNGEVRFGKEFRIELNPYSAYTKERLHHIYKNDTSGFVYSEIYAKDGIPIFVPDPEGYHKTRKAMCNEKGEFEFTNLPAGDYYVIAFMLWDETGGGIMQHIQLTENETKLLEMSNF